MFVDESGFGDFGRSLRKAVKKVVKKAVAAPFKKTVIAPTKKLAKASKTLTRKTLIAPSKMLMSKGPTAALAKKIATKSPTAAKYLMPIETKMQKTSQPGQNIVDAPLINVYSSEGWEWQVPGNYIVNGQYTDETGIVWKTSKPAMIKIYSPYNDEAEVPEGLLVNGKYTDEDGNVWTVNRQVSIVQAAPLQISNTVPQREIASTTIQPTSVEQNYKEQDMPEEIDNWEDMSSSSDMWAAQDENNFPIVEDDNEQRFIQQDIQSMEAFRKDKGTQVGFLQKLFTAVFGL